MMKKILFPVLSLVLAVGVALPMAMPAAAHTEDEPYIVDLLAGQDEDVGDVLVWNDGDNIYVKYVLDTEAIAEGWVIVETHLYVGKNPPPTSAPGQFPYDDADASVTPTEVTYEISLDSICNYIMQLTSKGKVTGVMTTEGDGDVGVGPCDDVYIAAHAKVQKVEVETSTIQPGLAWQRSAETAGAIANFLGYGGQWDPETDGFTIPLDETQVVWDNGAYHISPGTPTGSFASWNYKGVVGTQGPSYDPSYGSDLRRFHATFTMPDGCTVTGGTLSTVGFDGIPINDNVYVFVNEDLIFWGGTRANVLPTFEGMSGIQALRGATDPPETDRWYIPGTLPPLTNLASGTNRIDVFTEENERWGGLGELVLSLDCETVITTTETAWGNGTTFGTNWAMYFTYHVQCMPGILWQIGTPDGTVNPIIGAAEFPVTGTVDEPSSWVWTASYDYTVGIDADPITEPSAPGYIGEGNVRQYVPPTDTRPPTDSTEVLNIHFTLLCSYDAGELVLYYDRYGSERDIILLDDVSIATVYATEGGYKAFVIPLPAVSSGPHTLTIDYDGGYEDNGHYIDYLKLVYE